MEQGAVTRIRLPYGEHEAWLVTSFDGVRQVTTEAHLSRAAIVGRDYPRLTPEPIVSAESVNVLDPPHSTRLRRLAARAFTHASVERMKPAIERVAGGLLEKVAEHGPPVDLARHLSARLPGYTICELLNVPVADRTELLHRTQQMLAISPKAQPAAAAAKAHLRAYFTALVAERRTTPGEDLISRMTVPGPEDEEPLSDQEAAVLALTLILSGNDTATCQISNIVYTLLTRPGLWAHLLHHRDELAATLDELLRYLPFDKGVGIHRLALEDVEICGSRIRAGDYVHVSYLTADRDPAVFPHPDVLDPHRPARPHMTFGWGGHHCLATHLALAELHTAINALLTRFPWLQLAGIARPFSTSRPAGRGGGTGDSCRQGWVDGGAGSGFAPVSWPAFAAAYFRFRRCAPARSALEVLRGLIRQPGRRRILLVGRRGRVGRVGPTECGRSICGGAAGLLQWHRPVGSGSLACASAFGMGQAAEQGYRVVEGHRLEELRVGALNGGNRPWGQVGAGVGDAQSFGAG
ncbi:cytochrome P450, partial [Streptomyces griseofuscus]|uniref:cytochrome P450 n=2 Tax=Streptomyces griseofuscus TaxID=146922 RepID=UPI0037223F3C